MRLSDVFKPLNIRIDREQLGTASKKFLAAGPTRLAFPDTPETSSNGTLTFIPAEAGPTDYNADLSKTRQMEMSQQYLDQRRKALMLDVAEMEFHLGVEVQWEPNDADFVNTKQYIATRDYQVALLNLQRLVVQRLFELHKMNLLQTGKTFYLALSWRTHPHPKLRVPRAEIHREEPSSSFARYSHRAG